MAAAATPLDLLRSTVRPEALDFSAYVPGLSIEEIKERHLLHSVIKLASNENPLGASPVVQKALSRHAAEVFRYPQAGNPRLTAALASHAGVAPGRIVAGNGSDEIIDLLVRVKVRPGQDHVLTFAPCFSIYALQARLCGVELRQVPLAEDFSLPLQALAAAANEHTALVFVTSPDNPSGATATADDLAALARSLPPQSLLVVDEAYIDFVDHMDRYSLLPRLAELPNVALLRTFSKAYGLAGLRLGYGILPEWLADLLHRVRLPFSVNLLAEVAGLAALTDEYHYRATVAVTKRGRALLRQGLEELGCRVWPSQANFLMFTPPQGCRLEARGIFEALLSRGIIIRPLASYGLAGHLRVSVGNERENVAFLAGLTEVLHG